MRFVWFCTQLFIDLRKNNLRQQFRRCFKKIYEAVYELNTIEGQNYIPQGKIEMIYDDERKVDENLNYYIKAKKPFSEISDECYMKILGSLSCYMKNLKV